MCGDLLPALYRLDGGESLAGIPAMTGNKAASRLFFCPPGRPKAKSAPLGGSESAKRMSVGAFFAWWPACIRSAGTCFRGRAPLPGAQ